MIILSWLAFLLVWRLFVLKGLEWREAFLSAAVVSGVLIILSTEGLTLFSAIRFWPLVVFWSAVSGLTAVLLSRHKEAFVIRLPRIVLSWAEKTMLAGGGLVLAIVLFIALYAPPNTWDSMTYHMARVAHWAANGGVMNYPTNIIRQLVYFPYAEYAVLQGVVLTGGDHVANTVQWTAMPGVAIGVSLLARELGAERRWQIAAALVVITTPMMILQGSSTQTDLVTALWVAAVAVFSLLFFRTGSWHWGVLMSGALVLAGLTKGTGVLWGMPFVLIALIGAGVSLGRKLLLACCLVAMAVLLAGSFWGRLTSIDPSPSKAMALSGSVIVEAYGPGEILSNALRGLTAEIMVPWRSWNRALVSGVLEGHRYLGIDPASSATTTGGGLRDLFYFLDEDHASAPLQVLLIVAAGMFFWGVRGRPLSWGVFIGALGVGVLLCCGMIKWQPWIVRFHLPFLVLALPLAVAVMARVLPAGTVFLLTGILAAAACQALLWNNSRGLMSEKSMLGQAREELYFFKHPTEKAVVDRIAAMVGKTGCSDVGIDLGSDDWEYTWQALLPRGTRIEHVNVKGPSARFAYPQGAFQPCFVVTEVDAPGRMKNISYRVDPGWMMRHGLWGQSSL